MICSVVKMVTNLNDRYKELVVNLDDDEVVEGENSILEQENF